MSLSHRELLRFGDCEFDATARVVRRDGVLIALPPKAFDLLAVLLEHRGHVVDKATLMERLWPDTFVEEGNLPVTVHALRKALGDHGDTYIRTVPRRGYCFTATASVVDGAAAAGYADGISPRSATQPCGQPTPAPDPVLPAEGDGAVRSLFHDTRARWSTGAAAALVAAALLAVLWIMPRVRDSGNGLARVQSMAVLPFQTLGGTSRSDEVMGTGFGASIATDLIGLDEVIVRPFTSSQKFVGPSEDVVEAGESLRVDAVLSGSIRLLGPNAQVSAALVRVADGARLWSHAATAPASELARMERSLVEQLVGALEPDGADDAASRVHRAPPAQAAFEAYLRARAAAGTWTVRETERALALYTESVARDPAFADAHAGLAAMLVLPPANALSREAIARARESAARALALDPGLSEAQSAFGRAMLLDTWDWTGAERAFRAGIASAPYDAEPHVWYAQWFSARGLHEQALAEIRLAQDIDPTSPRVNLYVGTVLLAARRFEEGAAQLRKTPIEMGVVNQQVYLGTAVAFAKQQRWSEALAVTERMVRTAPSGPASAYKAYVLAEAGRAEEADSLLADLARQGSSRRTPHIVLAAGYACRARMDEAFAHLDTAYEDREPRLLFLKVDPMLDCLRQDPRYAAAVRRIGLEP